MPGGHPWAGYHTWYSTTHFTDDFSLTFWISRKICLNVIHFLSIRLQPNFARAMTAMLSWHMQNFVAITMLEFGWSKKILSIEFELWWKNISEMCGCWDSPSGCRLCCYFVVSYGWLLRTDTLPVHRLMACLDWAAFKTALTNRLTHWCLNVSKNVWKVLLSDVDYIVCFIKKKKYQATNPNHYWSLLWTW